MAEIKFLGYLAEVSGVRKKELVLETPTALKEILPPAFPPENIIILIDGKVGNLDSLIHPGQSVVLMPVLSGG